MLLDRIAKELGQNGYRKNWGNQSGVFTFVKTRTDYNEYVVFLNLPDELPTDVQWLIGVINQIKYRIGLLENDRILFVYLADEPDKLKVLCQETVETQWILDRNQLQLIIYENQSVGFEEIRNLIENAMYMSEPKKKFTSYATAFLVAVNVLIFLVTYYKIYFVWGEQSRSLFISKVGLYWPEVIYHNEYWRLVSSMFIHSGVEHLVNNMTLLLFAGIFLEERIGHVKFILLYFISGILAGLVSMGYNILNEDLIVSIGASGAIFGLVGALVSMVLISKELLGEMRGLRFIVFVGLSIYCGFGNSDIDNLAHIGGLVSGFVLTSIMLYISKIKRNGKKGG